MSEGRLVQTEELSSASSALAYIQSSPLLLISRSVHLRFFRCLLGRISGIIITLWNLANSFG